MRSRIPSSTSSRSKVGHWRRNRWYSAGGREPHHALDAAAVVPAAVEQHDLARRGQVLDVALEVPLGALPLGGRGQRDDAADARVEVLHHPLDRATLARGVAALEHDDEARTGGLHPLLHLDELRLQAQQLGLVALPGQPLARGAVPSVSPFPAVAAALAMRPSSDQTPVPNLTTLPDPEGRPDYLPVRPARRRASAIALLEGLDPPDRSAARPGVLAAPVVAVVAGAARALAAVVAVTTVALSLPSRRGRARAWPRPPRRPAAASARSACAPRRPPAP